MEEEEVAIDDIRFIIEDEVFPGDKEKDRFDILKSTISWNLEEFENNKHATDKQNSSVTCQVKNLVFMKEGFWDIASTTRLIIECKHIHEYILSKRVGWGFNNSFVQ